MVDGIWVFLLIGREYLIVYHVYYFALVKYYIMGCRVNSQCFWELLVFITKEGGGEWEAHFSLSLLPICRPRSRR